MPPLPLPSSYRPVTHTVNFNPAPGTDYSNLPRPEPTATAPATPGPSKKRRTVVVLEDDDGDVDGKLAAAGATQPAKRVRGEKELSGESAKPQQQEPPAAAGAGTSAAMSHPSPNPAAQLSNLLAQNIQALVDQQVKERIKEIANALQHKVAESIAVQNGKIVQLEKQVTDVKNGKVELEKQLASFKNDLEVQLEKLQTELKDNVGSGSPDRSAEMAELQKTTAGVVKDIRKLQLGLSLASGAAMPEGHGETAGKMEPDEDNGAMETGPPKLSPQQQEEFGVRYFEPGTLVPGPSFRASGQLSRAELELLAEAFNAGDVSRAAGIAGLTTVTGPVMDELRLLLVQLKKLDQMRDEEANLDMQLEELLRDN